MDKPRCTDKVIVDGIVTTRAGRTVLSCADMKLIDKLDRFLVSTKASNIAILAALAYTIGEHLAHASTETPDGDAEWVKDGIKAAIDLTYAFAVKEQASEEDKPKRA